MATTTYTGSCHCKAVTFEADIDLSKGTSKCNCTYCWRQGMWTASPEPGGFRLLTGEDRLGDYGKSGDWGEGHHRFCTVCGIHTHGHGDIAMIGGPYVSVQIRTLENLTADEILAAPVRYQDGLHDDWMHEPTETRQL